MNDYYAECLETIEKLIERNELQQARKMIDEELGMPYVPKEFDKKLRSMKNEIRSEEKVRWMDDETIVEYLKKDEAHQLIALDTLRRRNLRNYTDLIQKWLDEAKSLNVVISLIEICISQQISEKYTITKNGEKISFVPSECVLPHESSGFQQCLNTLRDWISDEDPTFGRLCEECAVLEAYLHLPDEIKKEDSEAMAAAIVGYVAELMFCEEEMKRTLLEKKASQKGCFELLLYSNII